MEHGELNEYDYGTGAQTDLTAGSRSGEQVPVCRKPCRMRAKMAHMCISWRRVFWRTAL